MDEDGEGATTEISRNRAETECGGRERVRGREVVRGRKKVKSRGHARYEPR